MICGFGRLGTWFGAQHFGVEPDLMPIAKGLSSGYVPIGGVVIGDRVADAVIDAGGDFNHGYTYSGHPVSCAVAAENLRIMAEEGIVERVASHTAGYFARRWAELGDHPLVGEARSLGLMGALELVADKRTLAPFAKEGDTGLICREFCFREGLIMRAVRDCMIVSPPLVISDDEIDELVRLARRCLDLTLEQVRGTSAGRRERHGGPGADLGPPDDDAAGSPGLLLHAGRDRIRVHLLRGRDAVLLDRRQQHWHQVADDVHGFAGGRAGADHGIQPQCRLGQAHGLERRRQAHAHADVVARGGQHLGRPSADEVVGGHAAASTAHRSSRPHGT